MKIIDFAILIALFLGFWCGRKRGFLLSLYRVISMIVAIFVFYRWEKIWVKLLEAPLGYEKAKAISLLSVVAIILFLMRLNWLGLMKLMEIVSSAGVLQFLGAIMGAIYGLLWMAVIARALSYIPHPLIDRIFIASLLEKYFVPLTTMIYQYLIFFGSKIFGGGS